MTEPRRTPLDGAHHEAGGRFITFAGWRLPVHYGSILAEAKAVRERAGMFDVSHMGRVRVRGADALETFRTLSTNDLNRIGPGKAQYTAWCTPDGGTIDDLIVFWTGDQEFLVVFNASRHEDDFAHLEEHATTSKLVDETAATAMIAVQGPDAIAAVEALGGPASSLPRFGVARMELSEVGVGAVVSRTGYTGEDGVELTVDAGAGPRVWEALREEGVVPCGLGARDALRMEMGFPLYGHELGLDISPLEAGLAFAVSFEDHEFIGSDTLRKQAAEGPRRKLVGFVCSRPAVPQAGDAIEPQGVEGDPPNGVVTSGGTSVVLEKPIGLAFVPPKVSPGPATLLTRGREIASEIRSLPLIERKRPKKA